MASSDSVALLSARGAFYQVPLASDATSAAKSFYAVNGLTINANNAAPQSPVLIDGIHYMNMDIVSRVPCLNNFKVYYSFGQNFGNLGINGSVLLGPMGNTTVDGVNRVLSFFQTNRVSVSKKPIIVHITNKAYYVYLEGLQIMDIISEYHIMPFSFSGTLLDIGQNGNNLLNPDSVVLSDVSLNSGSLATALTVNPTPIPAVPASVDTAASTATVNASSATSVNATTNTNQQQAASSNPTATLSKAPASPQAIAGQPTNADAIILAKMNSDQTPSATDDAYLQAKANTAVAQTAYNAELNSNDASSTDPTGAALAKLQTAQAAENQASTEVIRNYNLGNPQPASDGYSTQYLKSLIY